jgi:hypothetical protein
MSINVNFKSIIVIKTFLESQIWKHVWVWLRGNNVQTINEPIEALHDGA